MYADGSYVRNDADNGFFSGDCSVHPEDMPGPQEKNNRGLTLSDEESTGSGSEYEYETDETEDGVSIIEIDTTTPDFRASCD
jgi:hypothetical protein